MVGMGGRSPELFPVGTGLMWGRVQPLGTDSETSSGHFFFFALKEKKKKELP